MFNWIRNFKQRKATKKFIKCFLANISDSVILKRWEHRSWGDAIYIGEHGFYGNISCVRPVPTCPGVIINFLPCDLHDRDVIVMDVKTAPYSQREGKNYEIGLFANVKTGSNPPDFFTASYVRLGFADDYSLDTIKNLAKNRISCL